MTDIRDQENRFTSARNQSLNNSNQEAIEHAESSELEEPIRMFMHSCIYPAFDGGANRLVNIYTLHQHMEAQHPQYLERLSNHMSLTQGEARK